MLYQLVAAQHEALVHFTQQEVLGKGLSQMGTRSVVPSVMGQLFISELSTSPLQAARERSLERDF